MTWETTAAAREVQALRRLQAVVVLLLSIGIATCAWSTWEWRLQATRCPPEPAENDSTTTGEEEPSDGG